MTRDEAIKQLEALTHVEALKVITSEHDCGGGKEPGSPGFDMETCSSYEHPLTHPRHFVIHDIVSVAPAPGPRAEKGLYRAHSAEGDYCEGQPEALLARLTEVNKV